MSSSFMFYCWFCYSKLHKETSCVKTQTSASSCSRVFMESNGVNVLRYFRVLWLWCLETAAEWELLLPLPPPPSLWPRPARSSLPRCLQREDGGMWRGRSARCCGASASPPRIRRWKRARVCSEKSEEMRSSSTRDQDKIFGRGSVWVSVQVWLFLPEAAARTLSCLFGEF